MIEKAGYNDLPEILDLQYLAYQSEAALFGTQDIPPLKQTLEEVVDEFNTGIILKLLADNRMIGSVRAKEKDGTVYIGKLMVHPGYRCKGYGSELLSEIESYFPGKRYELFTSTRSRDNIRLYEKNGYTAFGRKKVNDELEFVYMEKMPDMKRKVIEMTRKEKALDYFSRRFHCSQSVLAAFADKCGLTEEQALKAAGCFGGGMRKGEVCGACTGALMVLGMLYGHADENDLESRSHANKVTVEMMNRFKEKNGSYLCRDILKCNLATSEGTENARKNDLFGKVCPSAIASAVEILEEIIAENE